MKTKFDGLIIFEEIGRKNKKSMRSYLPDKFYVKINDDVDMKKI